LVVWRSGSTIVLYRGANYKYPYFIDENKSDDESSPDAVLVNDGDTKTLENFSPAMDGRNIRPTSMGQRKMIKGVGLPNRVRFQLPGEAQLAEEADCLLDGLGPRFTDWWGYDPLPVDADLLPAVVPGYRRPFRLLPFGIQPKLTNDEMTTLRRLSRPLPCHFALGQFGSSFVILYVTCRNHMFMMIPFHVRQEQETSRASCCHRQALGKM